MPSAKPFGNLEHASILVIGHDPRLQNSLAQAEYAFFFNYLLEPRPRQPGEGKKYDLACAVWKYMSELAGKELPVESLYVTNLCNEFLPPTQGRGTVFIPGALAQAGTAEITRIAAAGHFRVIVPLSAQVSYGLGSQGFFDEGDERLYTYLQQAKPKPAQAAAGVYATVGKSPFLQLCGQRFHHKGVPVVPVLHVKQWPLGKQMVRYRPLMENAGREIRLALAE